MGCDKIKPPEIPSVDPSKLPVGVSFPGGQDADSFAASASKNSTLSDAVKGAENLIDKNVKSATEALNPEKIGEAIGTAIAGVANTITGLVDSAVAGVNGVADSISKLGQSPLEKNSPEALVSSVKAKTTEAELALLKQKKKCEEEFIKKAAEKNAEIKSKATAKADALSPEVKKAMASDPEEKARQLAKIENEVKEEMHAKLTEEQKEKPVEEKSVQDILHAELIIPVQKSGAEKIDPHFTDMLLKQMCFYQLKMHECIRSIQVETTALLTDAGLIKTSATYLPEASIYKIYVSAIKFQVYARLAGGLTDEWRIYYGIKNTYTGPGQTTGSPETDLTPEDVYPQPDNIYVKNSGVTFSQYMRQLRGDVYGPNAKTPAYTTDGKKKSGEDMLKEYFSLWMYGAGDGVGTWMHQFGGDRWYDEQSAPGKLLKGTPPQEYTSGESGSNSGLSDSGLLSVDDSINQFIDYTWYGELEKYLFNSQSARNPRFSLVDGHDLNNILSTYIWGPEGAWGRDGPTVLGAQNEIFSSLAKASSDLTSQSPWRGPISSTSGEIVISIDNSTGLDDQIYLKQFIISAEISWAGELKVSNISLPVLDTTGAPTDISDTEFNSNVLSSFMDTKQMFEMEDYYWYPCGIQELAFGQIPVFDDSPREYTTSPGGRGMKKGAAS